MTHEYKWQAPFLKVTENKQHFQTSGKDGADFQVGSLNDTSCLKMILLIQIISAFVLKLNILLTDICLY